MTKTELKEVTATFKEQTKNALQMLFDELNQGQQQKLLKNEEIVKLFDTYGVVYTDK